MESYEIIKNYELFSKRINDLKTSLDIDKKEEEVKELEKRINDASFYNDINNSQIVLKKYKSEKNIIDTYYSLLKVVNELKDYYEMQKNEEFSKEELEGEIQKNIDYLSTNLKTFEKQMLLSGEYDDNDALIELHPGAGGTESLDWALMLFRMYKRYAEAHDFAFEVLDYIDGDGIGIKSVTFTVKGPNAYGLLKSEQGVHRLVRISPFDSGARRHTTFCGCTVIPVIDNSINIDIKQDDLRVDVFRSTGNGGQFMNKTDSAVRITHLKTGVVVVCQSQRSQLHNREEAMRILKAKLYQLELEKNEKQIRDINKEQSVNGFSGQIRSYILHPYSLVKDHRSGYESNEPLKVLDGELDEVIDSYLYYLKKKGAKNE